MNNPKIHDYIAKQKSPQREVCSKLREIIFDTYPEIKEAMKWGVPAFDDGKFYIVALKDHVNLGFSIKGLKEQEIELFDGGGKTTKVLEISSLDEIKERSDEIIKLLKLVGGK